MVVQKSEDQRGVDVRTRRCFLKDRNMIWRSMKNERVMASYEEDEEARRDGCLRF